MNFRHLVAYTRSIDLEKLLMWSVLPLCLIYHLLSSMIGWHNTISDSYGFRQTQTAITSFYFLKGGPLLSYQTPILGPPWTVPFEFPLYQAIVSSWVRLTQMPLNESGRLVSLIFFYLSLIASNFLMVSLGWSRLSRALAISFVLVSPLYIFWSRTFMIESTALFFSMLYAAFAVRSLKKPSRIDLLFACITGSIAALVKITTLAGFLIPIGILCLAWLRSNSPLKNRANFQSCLALLVSLCLVPVAVGMLWTHFADAQKLSPLSADFVSKNLTQWTFGTLDQRLSLQTWRVFYDRLRPEILGLSWISGLLLMPLILFSGRRIETAVLIICGIAVLMTFTNLQYVHSYYAYSLGIFWLCACGVSIASGIEAKSVFMRVTALSMMAILIRGMVVGYHHTYRDIQANNNHSYNDLGVSIQGLTKPDDVILTYGLDWSSEVPYYAERRALMFYSIFHSPDDPQVQMALHSFEQDSTLHWGALVVCDNKISKPMLEKLVGLGFSKQSAVTKNQCDIYLPEQSNSHA